jgi:LacI family transcriptional regulator, gluconate utilization system Gnt-I transcriptional repressor
MSSGKPNVTLKDVSKAAGLSLITVSRALRQPQTVHADTRAKVHRAIDEIGYVPNLAARSLVSQRSDMVGVVVPILTSSLFADLTHGIANVLHQNNMQMLIAVSERSTEREAEAVRTFVARQADAIIVTGFTHSPACEKLLRQFGGPVVETWNLGHAPIDLSVGYDNKAASADMTRYLIDKGYRRIAMVGGAFENNDQATDRRDGFLDAMKMAGLPIADDFIISVPNPTTMEMGGEVMLRLMDRPDPPDAVFFQAELPAHGAMMACMSRGISIPEDVAIAGFGDLRLSALLPVPLTTVHIRAEEIGTCAAQMVIDRLADDVTLGPVQDIGYEIMARQSA